MTMFESDNPIMPRSDGGDENVPQYLALPLNYTIIQCGYHNPNKTPASEWQQCAYYYKLGDFAHAGHFGMDFTSTARPFYASGTGIVLGFSTNSANTVGKWLAIKYINVRNYGNLVVRYFHLADIHVSVGQTVTLNTKIATYGNTGTYTTGAHLHVEVDTDVVNWKYTPTLSSNNGGLFAGTRGSGDTTLNPAYVFKQKTSSPENQSVEYPEKGWYSGPKIGSFN